jgi:hypothetical protein
MRLSSAALARPHPWNGPLPSPKHVMKTEFYGNVGYKANFENLIRELSPLPA